jgi:hypothetical protein
MSWIRKYFTLANTVMTIALVFVMTGGAYAASKYVISSTKQVSPKVLAALKGKPGANGAQGPAGPAGAQGPAGPAGVKGETGAAGQNGAQGEKGVQGEKGTPGINGFNGTDGAKGPAGPTGPVGPTGSPWTAGGTLPVGSSETGEWSFDMTQAGATLPLFVTASISFGVPLEKAFDEEHSHAIGPEEGEGEPKFLLGKGEGGDHPAVREAFEKKECGGNVKEPKAASGNLCVFADPVEDYNKGFKIMSVESITIQDAESGEFHAGRSGAWLSVDLDNEAIKEGDFIWGSGDWVVTG